MVVDNASSDDSLDVVRERAPTARVVALDTNTGFAHGCNEAILSSTGAWVLTLNSDAELAPDAIARFRHRAAAAPDDVGMLQPRVRFRDRPEVLNSTGVEVFRGGHACDRDFGRPVAEGPAAGEVFCANGGSGLWRRRMLDDLLLPTGFFDRTFFMYFEDVDLGWRCQLAGWRCLYDPAIDLIHVWQGSSRLRGEHFVFAHCALNRVRCLLKNASWWTLFFGMRRTAGDLVWLFRREGSAALGRWLTAVWDGLRQRPAAGRSRRRGRRALERTWMHGRPPVN